jgi:predicted Ser/Thr protein kinase
MNEENMNPSFDSVLALLIEAAEQSAGQPLDADVWVERYPQFAEEIRNYVANRNQFEAVLGPKVAFDPEVNTLGLENASAQSGSRVRYFGDYELIDEIARGGMGVVYKAKQINLNRIVAIKMILSGQLASEQDVLRFRTEAEAAANLDHPRIVPIYEVGQYAGQHYFSMGFVDGKSLAQKIGDGPMAPREAAEMLVKICEGIAYAHDRGVIHRDLKPANILLDQNEQPKVTDFGLAKRLDSDSNLTGTGQILGTPSYMAPEQASGKIDEVGPLADIYSLGAILYCLLTGRPPFQASNPMDTLLQVIDKEPVPPRKLNPSVPLDLETITMRCLDKEPNRRFPSANALAEELERFLRGEPIQSRPIGPLERMRKWVRRRPQTAALIATAFLAISLVALGVPWMRMREAKLRENVGTLEQSLAARAGEVTVAQKAAKTALTEKQLTLRQKLEKEFEGFKVQVSANLDRIQAIRKEAVPGSSRDVESLFLETSALQKSMAAVAKQLGAVEENQSEAFWTEMRPRVHEEGIAWLASSRINSASSNANQPSVSLKGHAFAIAMRPTVKAGNISKAFAVSANGKWWYDQSLRYRPHTLSIPMRYR